MPEIRKKIKCHFWEKLIDGRTDRQTDRPTDTGDFIEPSVECGSNYHFMLTFRYYVTCFACYLLIIKFKEVCSYIKYDSTYMYREYWKYSLTMWKFEKEISVCWYKLFLKNFWLNLCKIKMSDFEGCRSP